MEDNIEIVLMNSVRVRGLDLSGSRYGQWRAVLGAVMNLQVP